MSSGITKKLVTPFEACNPTGAILLIDLLDPHLATIKIFLKAILDNDLHYFAVGNKMDLVSKEQIEKVKANYKEMMSGEGVGTHRIYFVISTKTGEGMDELKQAMDKKFKKGERIIILGSHQSGKTNLISCLIKKRIRQPTHKFEEYKYKDIVLIDTLGQVVDINKPLMVSIDLSDCTTLEEKIHKIFRKEARGIHKSYRTSGESIIKTIRLLKRQTEKGKKIITMGAGASALVAREIAGQGLETGLPVIVFTNDLSEAQPISFSKGLAEDEKALSRYISLSIQKGDCIIGISASGSTGFICQTFEIAKKKGAFTISITENLDSRLGRLSDIIIKSNAKPEGPCSSLVQTAHLVIGHAIILGLADERGLTAQECIRLMLPEKCETKKMGIK